MNHKDLIAEFSQSDLALLTKRSNSKGLVRLLGHLGLIFAFGAYVNLGLAGWQLVLVLHGICLIFLFTLLHETVHDTPFRSYGINRLIGAVCGFLIFIPSIWFRYFHLAHHRHTHDRENDPELEASKPYSLGAYLNYLSGVPVWISLTKSLWQNVTGTGSFSYVPGKAMPKVLREARITMFAYGVLAVCGFYFRLEFLFWLWLLPVLVGQPFLRAYLLAEHTDCAHVPNMLENTRTILTTPFVRFIAWNMPYHTEHHSFPNVPFHQLPVLHQKIKNHLTVVESGYVPFHQRKLGKLIGQSGHNQ